RTAGSAGGAGNPAPGPASGPTGSGPADPPPPTDPGNGPTNPPTGGGAPQTAIPHGYHVVAPDVRGLENLAVLTVSRGGQVLLSGTRGAGNARTTIRWIYDVKTGAVRDAPEALAVNDAGTTAGIRAAGKDSSGACDDFEV